MHNVDPLLDCLVELTRIYDRPSTHAALIAGLPIGPEGLTPSLFDRAASKSGFATRIAKIDFDNLEPTLLPVILLIDRSNACLLLKIDHEHAIAQVLLPETGQGFVNMPLASLAERYSGRAIFARPRFKLDQRTPGTQTDNHHWFWSAFAEQLPLYKDVLVAAFLINLFAIVVPIFSMNIYDRVIPSQAKETLWMLTLGTVLALALDYLLKIIRAQFIDLAGSRIDSKLSTQIMERVLGMRLEDKPMSVGSFAQTLRSFESIRDFISSVTVTAIIDLPFAIVFVILIGWIAWPLVFTPLLAALIIVAFSISVEKTVRKLTEQLSRVAALRNATLIESLSALETLKSLGAENHIQRRWEQISNQLAKLNSTVRHKNHLATTLVGSISAACVVLNLVIGVYLIDLKMLSVGGLIASGMLISRVIAPFVQIVNLIMQYENANVSLKTLEHQMRSPQERPEEMTFIHREHIHGDIEFKNVKFAYPNQENPSLNDVSFKIKHGEHVAIIGRTGSGKTTLSRLIMSMYQPTDGAIRIDGIDARQLDPADLRRNIGYVEQNAVLFFGSLRENITLSTPYAEDSQILQAVETGLLSEMVNHHPRGIDMLVGERGEFLSGGQRQSVAVARAVLNSPSILLFDEPTSAMDFSTESKFIQNMKHYSDNRTMVLITHKMNLLALVDRVIVIDQGKIVADGKRDQIIEALNSGKVGQSG